MPHVAGFKLAYSILFPYQQPTFFFTCMFSSACPPKPRGRLQNVLCHLMIVWLHRNRFLVNKTNRCTEFQFYWYYGSTGFGKPFCPSSVLSRTAKNSWWWAERLPETCRVVIPIKLEFLASFGFIHKVLCHHFQTHPSQKQQLIPRQDMNWHNL